MNAQAIAQQLVTTAELSKYFSIEEIDTFSRYLKPRNIDANEILMSEGEPANCLMYLLSGKVRVLADNTQLNSIDIGGCFGESMFLDQGTRTASVQAVEKSVLAEFTLEDYSSFISYNSSLAVKFKNYFIGIKARHDDETHGLLYRDHKKYLALIAHN